jgi:hypothetical protein
VSQGLKPLVSRWPVLPGLKSGPISEAKATTEQVYAEGVRRWHGVVGLATDYRRVVLVEVVFEIGPGFSPDNQAAPRDGL